MENIHDSSMGKWSIAKEEMEIENLSNVIWMLATIMIKHRKTMQHVAYN